MPGPITAKVDWEFNSIGGTVAGWTETHYIGSASIEAALTAETAAGNLVLRRVLLADSYYVTEIRVSDVAILRDSLAAAFSPNQTNGQYGGPSHQQFVGLPPWTRLLIRMEATSAARRSYEMGGIPTVLLTPSFAWNNLEPWWVANFPAFRTAHLPGGTLPWQIRRVAYANPFTAPGSYSGIQSWLVSPFGDTAVLTLSNPFSAAPPRGALVKVSGVAKPTTANRVYTVTGGTAGILILRPVKKPIIGTVSGGFVGLGTVTYAGITSMIPQRGSKRNTGRPFGELHGRARVTA